MEYRESGRIAGTIGEIVSVLTEKQICGGDISAFTDRGSGIKVLSV